MCLTHSGDDDHDDGLMEVSAHETTIVVAIDSSSVANVIHPDELPVSVLGQPNMIGRYFKGANDVHIEDFGCAQTLLKDDQTGNVVGCGWTLTDVPLPFQSVMKMIGTVEHPKQDVLFCAGKAVVVPAGTVGKLLTSAVQPIL